MGRCLRLTSRSETPSVDLSYLHRWTFPLSLWDSHCGRGDAVKPSFDARLWFHFQGCLRWRRPFTGSNSRYQRNLRSVEPLLHFFHSTRPCFEIIHRLKRLHLTGSFDFQAEWIKLDERGDYRIYGFIFLRLPFLWKCMEFREWNWVTEILMTSKRDRLIYYPFIVYTHYDSIRFPDSLVHPLIN